MSNTINFVHPVVQSHYKMSENDINYRIKLATEHTAYYDTVFNNTWVPCPAQNALHLWEWLRTRESYV